MSSDFRQAFKSIRQSVVGIGYRDNSGFHIFGTGFIVDSSGLIMTNRHVIEPLLIETEKEVKIKAEAMAFLFVQDEIKEGNFKTAGVRAIPIQQIFDFPDIAAKEPSRPFPILPGYQPGRLFRPDPADIGFCKIELRDCPPDTLPLKPVTIIDSANITEGTPIGFLGFPQGLQVILQSPTTSAPQLTPLLQTGVIAGMLPHSGLPKPDAFVLDTYVNGGSSGSPLFDTDGQVIGVVYATRLGFSPLAMPDGKGGRIESSDVGVFMPSALGLAVPSARFPKDILPPKTNT